MKAVLCRFQNLSNTNAYRYSANRLLLDALQRIKYSENCYFKTEIKVYKMNEN